MGKFKEIKLGFLRLEVVQYEIITKQNSLIQLIREF